MMITPKIFACYILLFASVSASFWRSGRKGSNGPPAAEEPLSTPSGVPTADPPAPTNHLCLLCKAAVYITQNKIDDYLDKMEDAVQEEALTFLNVDGSFDNRKIARLFFLFPPTAIFYI